VDSLTVSLYQKASSLDPAENRAALDVVRELSGGDPRPDVVVLPEVFARDFGKPGSHVGEFAEPLDGPFVTRLTELAKECDLTVVAGMFEVSDDPARPFNTLVVVGPGGQQTSYRKIHLYDSFGYKESDALSAGALEPVVVEIGGWSVGLMTCYDLRFPEMSRALVDASAEVLLVPAAWVAGPMKVDHWCTLLAARAIENTAYVVAAAQPPPRYCGHSMAVAPNGVVMAELADEDGAAITAELDREFLAETRKTNPSLLNRRL
jgi:deaminated glutathione amidase